MQDAVADVARVAVAEQDVAERGRARRDPPAVQPLAVVGGDRDVVERQPRRGRGLLDRPRREVDQRVEQPADQSSG
ncbi:MAG TPA: hypothetical protein VGJ32_10150 [Solirubrobacteraceae bacterium]